MKINLLKRLLVFGSCAFFTIVFLIVSSSLFLKTPSWNLPYFAYGILFIYGLILVHFVKLLNSAGIWMAHSLPSQIKYNKWPWIRTALTALTIALIAILASHLEWMPLIWSGIILPIIYSICLYFFLWGTIAPILSKTSSLQFSRTIAFFLLAPVLALIPLTGLVVSHSLVSSYFQSYPGKFNYSVDALTDLPEEKPVTAEPPKDPAYTQPDYKIADAVKGIRQAVLANQSCEDQKKEVQKLLENSTPEDQLYWAIKGVKCSDISSVVAIPKLVNIMNENPHPIIRSSAIIAIGKLNPVTVKNIAYLIIKKLSSTENMDVIQSAAMVLKKLGGNDESFAASRLVKIITPENAEKIGHLLMTYFDGSSKVANYVQENIFSTNQKTKHGAIDLICSLKAEDRPTGESAYKAIITDLSSKNRITKTTTAITCLGEPAYKLILSEIENPQIITRNTALEVFHMLPGQFQTTSFDTLKTCVEDMNALTRKLCARGIGQVGSKALPTILDLIKSDDPEKRETGQIALSFVKDESIMEQLKNLRDENSGWFANAQNLRTAESIQIAIARGY